MAPRQPAAIIHVQTEEVAAVVERPNQAVKVVAGSRVVDVMHRGVVTCRAETAAVKVAMMMIAHRVHVIVVVSLDALPRLVADTHIAASLYAGELESVTADEIASPAPLVALGDSVDYALARMHERQATHAVAVDRSYRPVGVVSVLDVLEQLRKRHVE